MARDTRRDEGQYYPYGKRVLPPGYQPDDDVKHSDFDGVEPLPERFNDDDVRTKINTVINALKGASAAVVVMLLGATAFGAGVTVQTAPKSRIYNDEQIVTNVVFDATGLATTQEVESVRDELGSVSNDVAALSDSVKTNAAAIATLVDTKANDDVVVKLSGDQFIGGKKTFNHAVVVKGSLTGVNYFSPIYQRLDWELASDDSGGFLKFYRPVDAFSPSTVLRPQPYSLSYDDYTIFIPDKDGTMALTSDIPDISGKVEQNDFDAATNSIAGTIAPLAGIPALIPAQASPTNQLADKQFVNSSIATSTANFCGTSAATNEAAFVEWLEAIEVANDNDYVFWQTEDGDGNAVFKRYKYVEDPSGLGEEALAGHWLFEYDLNNSSFTAVQWAAINSGVTSDALANKADKSELAGYLPLAGGSMHGDIIMNNPNDIDYGINQHAIWVIPGSWAGILADFSSHDGIIQSGSLDNRSATFTQIVDAANGFDSKADATNVYTKSEMDAQLGRRGVDIPTGSTDVDAHGCVHNAPVELGLDAKATVDLSGLSSNAIVRSVSTAIGNGADASNPDNPALQQGIAVGNQARAKGTNAIAIGAGVRHEDEDDLTGDNVYAGANEAIAGGYSAKATASQAVAWGSRAKAHAPGAWQLGEGVNSNRNTLAFRDYQLLGEDGQVPYERVAGAVAQAGVEFEVALSNAVRRILAGGNMAVVGDGSEGEQILEPKVGGLSEVEFVPNTNGQYEASTLVYLDPPPQAARNYDILISEIPEPGWLGTNGWETVALENRLRVGFTDLPPQYGVTMHVDESCGFPSSPRVASVTNAPTIVKVREVSTNKVLVVVKPYRLEDL